MRKIFCVLTGFALIFGLFGCVVPQPPQASTAATTESTTQATTEAAPSTAPTTVSTAPLHTELYIVGVSTKVMLKHFNEVVLQVEYSDGTGNPSLVQKWTEPIYYCTLGNPTDEDIQVLEKLFSQLNQIEGFPGIYPAENESTSNLTLSFLAPAEFRDQFSGVVNGEDAYGATQFWYYTDSNQIYNARIGYRTDIPQEERNSILLEEIVNTLGLGDSENREDSIVYQYSNTNLQLSQVDWVILKLLYSPAIECGMDATACEAIIERLYY